MEGGQEGSEDDLNNHPTIEEPAAEAADIWDNNIAPYEWDDREDTPDNEPTLVQYIALVRYGFPQRVES
jgi:hypothetical protein